MKYLREYKNTIILSLLGVTGVLLAIRLIFFLQDGTNKAAENLLIRLIAYVSLCTIILIFIPVKQNLKQVLVKYRDLIALSFFMFYTELLFILDNDLRYSFVTLFSLTLIVSIINTILVIIPPKWKYGVMVFITIFYTIYYIAQDIYFDIFSDFFSYKEIVSLKAGLEFTGGVIHFRFIHLLFIVLAIGTLIFITFYRKDNRIKLSKKTATIFYIPLTLLVLVNFNAQYPANYARLYSSDHYLYYSRYNNSKFISRFGAINYSVRDFFNSIIPKTISKRDLNAIESFYQQNQKDHQINEFTGIFTGKNLVFINAESFDGIGVDKDLTPNIWRLQNEGVYFSNHYVPVYPRTTSDSEFIFNTSLIPSISDGPTCYTFHDNYFTNSLANLFTDKGYQANAFHNNRKDFYLRYKVFPNLGYENFYDFADLGLTSENRRFDSIFMKEAKDYILPTDGNFFSFITTLSGHSPYNEDNRVAAKHYHKVDAKYGDNMPEEIKYYLATQIEVDYFVGELFNALEEKGLYDNTVIIFTGDHYPYTIKTETYENYTGVYEEYLKNQTPLYIWSSDISAHKIDKLTSSFDILPTLANLFNLDADYSTYFGNDVFNNNYQPIVFYKDYSWYDGNVYVVDGEILYGSTNEDVQQTSDLIFEYFEVGQKILRTDYFSD